MKIEKLIKDAILSQEAYFIEEAPCRIKLDANENPYTLSEELRKEMEQYIKKVSLNRYPDPGSRLLKRRLAENLHVDEEMLLIGNGSDELIHLLLLAFRSDPAGGVVIPVPTFAMYKISAVNAGHEIIEVPLNDDFDLDLDEMTAAMSRFDPDLVFLSYPNNPTGNLFNRDTIERLLSRSRGIVVVDEAYHPFSETSFLPDLRRWENLVVLRTLSKMGFAALRLGILIAHPAIVRELNKVRLPYNVNALSQAVGLFVLDHELGFHRQALQIIDERKKLFEALQELNGITPYRSDANFILFSCALQKNAIYESLLERGIVIKNFSSPEPLQRCMRVTVGREDENQEFLSALRDILRQ
jgi:histidinol-phosphate aminotransferase